MEVQWLNYFNYYLAKKIQKNCKNSKSLEEILNDTHKLSNNFQAISKKEHMAGIPKHSKRILRIF